ncbi:amino acid ABC transporter permease [Pectinatus sottacetonis]|uniref:amino acid ABC transporter permease n=1 Tax=Pectinatus sottacetonis TaxID=1002795 RepID=UPI0018C49532|nr:amino acid ABC transporter permease [Pectinatus sottacetonis]
MSILDVFLKYSDMFWAGTKMTVSISFFSIIGGLIIGTILALMKISKVGAFRWISNAYVELIRGTPVLVQISIAFFGLPMLGINFPSMYIGGVSIDRVASGILALTINTSAYICEIVRSGIQSVEKGQMEAARSLGFNSPSAMRLVVLPQAIKNILPALGNEFVTIIKTSSQVSVIGMADLMYTANTIQGISFQPMQPLFIVAAIYFVITFTISCGVRYMEKYMGKST